jgi:predicted nucleotidyltransferase
MTYAVNCMASHLPATMGDLQPSDLCRRRASWNTETMPNSPLTILLPALQSTNGIAAVVLGGSRARGTATEASDYDVGLYFHREQPLDVDGLRRALEPLVDAAPTITKVGEWGPWIVGGGWLRVSGQKVDLLYRPFEDVAEVIEACRAGEIQMEYQPGHPHGFCSAIWAGEVALCKPLHDPDGALAALKTKANPYPEPLRAALTRRFFWEVQFSIENAELGAARQDQTHVYGCAYRALACTAQTLFALNRRYLINEKGALDEAASFPDTVERLSDRVTDVWRALADGGHAAGLHELRSIELDLRALVTT